MYKTRKRLSVLTAVLLSAAMLAGCGGGSDADKNTGDSGNAEYSQDASDGNSVNDSSNNDANDMGWSAYDILRR